ncbi:hypothetical protein ACGFZK_07450 [Streptomyces sp. NPDC048257]|uniref:hypothetical protein n=1 Tax=Streptomyces sp. NPDC048257 TaxID=3365526 RepID=UPI00371C2CE8
MAVPDRMDERLRALGLVEAQRMAQAVLADVTGRGLIAPGRTERRVDARIAEVARRVFRASRTCGPARAVSTDSSVGFAVG